MGSVVGVDRSATGYDQLMAAQERIATVEARAAFAMSFLRCEGLFELMWPDERLRSIESDYRWLARVYASVQPVADPNALLGTGSAPRPASCSAGTSRRGNRRGRPGDDCDRRGDPGGAQAARAIPTGRGPLEPPTIDDVLDTLAGRLQRKLAGSGTHPVWRALSERLEELRRVRMEVLVTRSSSSSGSWNWLVRSSAPTRRS